jgi:hypothetical protein
MRLFGILGSKTRSTKSRHGFNIEKVLFFCYIVSFVLMVFVQVAITNPSVRTLLSVSSEPEGTPLAVEEFLYKYGEIVLQLVNADMNKDLKVLLNGEEAARFTCKTIVIKVKSGDVIEIDGSGTDKKMEVIVLSKSDNIVTKCVNIRAKVDSNIQKIVKVKIQ